MLKSETKMGAIKLHFRNINLFRFVCSPQCLSLVCPAHFSFIYLLTQFDNFLRCRQNLMLMPFYDITLKWILKTNKFVSLISRFAENKVVRTDFSISFFKK